ncbi:hypothetical protein [Membranihabitans marinus]|uniref:hypothetical protein n=1 Tax=Membranihabitans marinus TaxID=1227546 RepID=UPI001F3EDF44|nr:hypothetical protein [Membranihabitans marinus]
MNKLIGTWEMLPSDRTAVATTDRKYNTYVIKKVDKNKMMIQSEWTTSDNKRGFIGYTVNTDGIPRKNRLDNTKFIGKFRGKNVLTTTTMVDEQVESMVVREVLESGELKLTKIYISSEGEQTTQVQYYKKVQ